MPVTLLSHFLPFHLNTVLFGLYDYLLPIMLYCAWSALALLDLARLERARPEASARTAGWAVAIIALPVIGAALYLLAGRSALSRSIRLAAVLGGVVVVIAAYGLTFVRIG